MSRHSKKQSSSDGRRKSSDEKSPPGCLMIEGETGAFWNRKQYKVDAQRQGRRPSCPEHERRPVGIFSLACAEGRSIRPAAPWMQPRRKQVTWHDGTADIASGAGRSPPNYVKKTRVPLPADQGAAG